MSNFGPNIGGGLLIPNTRASSMPRFAESGLMLSRDEIADILNDPARVPARKRFPAGQYIKSQGGRGSCNGYAGAKALERARVLRGLPHVPLSGEGLYAQINGGRDGGSMLDDGMQAMMENGIPPESLVPHQEYLWNRISSEAKQAMRRFMGVECYGVDAELELASGLALGFIGVIAVHASGSYGRLDRDGVSGDSPGPGNHAVGVQDARIRAGELQFDSFNSWGRNWGSDGHNWVTWSKHLRYTVRFHQFYLIRSTIDDPQGDNPPVIK